MQIKQKKTGNKKKQEKAHRAHVTHCSRDTYTNYNVIYIIPCKSSRKC